jgi:hypothetical protein
MPKISLVVYPTMTLFLIGLDFVCVSSFSHLAQDTRSGVATTSEFFKDFSLLHGVKLPPYRSHPRPTPPTPPTYPPYPPCTWTSASSIPTRCATKLNPVLIQCQTRITPDTMKAVWAYFYSGKRFQNACIFHPVPNHCFLSERCLRLPVNTVRYAAH